MLLQDQDCRDLARNHKKEFKSEPWKVLELGAIAYLRVDKFLSTVCQGSVSHRRSSCWSGAPQARVQRGPGAGLSGPLSSSCPWGVRCAGQTGKIGYRLLGTQEQAAIPFLIVTQQCCAKQISQNANSQGRWQQAQ